MGQLTRVNIRLFTIEIQWRPNALVGQLVAEGDFDLAMRREAIQR